MIDSVKLILGQECNFNCVYCMQNKNSPIKKVDQVLCTDKVKKYLYEIQPKMIRLYGGEPLLYWDVFVDLVKFIKSNLPECELRTITNGFLLDKNKVDFCNENDIHLALSHDGRNNKLTRHIDVFEIPNKIDIFLSLKYKSINSVLSPVNFDMYNDLWGYFDKLFGTFVSVWAGPVKNLKHLPIFDLTSDNKKIFENTIKKVGENYYKSVKNGIFNSRECKFFDMYLQALHRKYNIGTNNKDLGCRVGASTLPMDIFGNIYICQNCSKKVLTVDNWKDFGNYTEKNKIQPEYCNNCFYKDICPSETCVLHDDYTRKEECYLRKTIFDELVKQLNRLKAENIKF